MKQTLRSLRAHTFFGTLAICLLLVGNAHALPLTLSGQNVGSLHTEGPFLANTATTGGVNFWAQWQLDPDQTLVDESNLRWLQLASFSKVVPGFPNPNRPFIDPRSGTLLGGILADNQPWYDITGPTKATLSLTGGGDDPWMGDGPFASWSLGPLSFIADTLVVAVTDWVAQEARVLGAFRWGYSIGEVGLNQTTIIPVTQLANTPELRSAFNTALALDFPGWTVVVPEPASLVLSLMALAALAVIARRARPRRAA